MSSFDDAEDIEFVKEEVDKLYKLSTDIHPDRWERARWEIDFYDFAMEFLQENKLLKGRVDTVISCPFHGRDSTPSFHFYRSSNSAFCFGCPPPARDQFYDSVSLVSRTFQISKRDALVYLEKRFKFPAILGEKKEDDEEISLTFSDLREPLLIQESSKSRTVAESLEVMSSFFRAMKIDDPLPIARLLGKERVKSVLRRKERGLV